MNIKDVTEHPITEKINHLKKMINGGNNSEELQNVIDMLQDFNNIYINITKDLLEIVDMTEKNNWVADVDIVTKTFIDYNKYDKLYKDFYVNHGQQIIDSFLSVEIKERFNSLLKNLDNKKTLYLKSCVMESVINKFKETKKCDNLLP